MTRAVCLTPTVMGQEAVLPPFVSSTAGLTEVGSGWITCTCLGTKSLFECSNNRAVSPWKIIYVYIYSFGEKASIYFWPPKVHKYIKLVQLHFHEAAECPCVHLSLRRICEKFYLLQAWLCV